MKPTNAFMTPKDLFSIDSGNGLLPLRLWNLKQNTEIFIQGNAFEDIICKISAILFRPQFVKEAVAKEMGSMMTVVEQH